MPTPRLIALYSPTPGCGKTTIAEHLCRKHGFVRISFADPMRAMMRALLMQVTDPSSVAAAMAAKESPTELPYRPTVRHMMRTLGTEWGRTCIGPHFWARIWVQRTADMIAAGASVVCDDMRFPEELGSVQGLGGEAWRVTRPGHDPIPGVMLHPSDAALEGQPMWWEHLIRNDGTPEMLLQYVDTCLGMELVQ